MQIDNQGVQVDTMSRTSFAHQEPMLSTLVSASVKLAAVIQAPCKLNIEPSELFTKGVLLLDAGASVPETTVSVSNGEGQQIIRSYMGGHKTSFIVVQRLWRLKDGVGEPYAVLR